MSGRLSTEDMFAVQEVLALYNWHFDAGDGDSWASLWTEDGEFGRGGESVPTQGRKALAALVKGAFETYGGGIRHHTTDIIAAYDGDQDTVQAKAHLLVTHWGDKAKFFGATHAKLKLVRTSEGWKIRSNTISITPADNPA